MLPTYFFLVCIGGAAGRRAWSASALARRPTPRDVQPAVEPLTLLADAARVRLGRRGADRRRGHLGRRAGLPEARVGQRAEDPDGDGRHPGHHVQRHHLPGQSHWRSCPGEPTAAETVVSQIARGVFGDRPAVLRGPVRDLPDPVPGRQHRLLRLPAAGLLPRPRPLPAAPVHLPRRPPGLLGRHRRRSASPRRSCCGASAAASAL